MIEERRIAVDHPRYREIYCAARAGAPAEWLVEAYRRDDDGAIEQTIFIGPEAAERADAYLAFRYGDVLKTAL